MSNMSIIATAMFMMVVCNYDECGLVSDAQDERTCNEGLITMGKFCSIFETWKNSNNIKKMTKVDYDTFQSYVDEDVNLCDYEKVIIESILDDMKKENDKGINEEDSIKQYKKFHSLLWEADKISRRVNNINPLTDHLFKPVRTENDELMTIQNCLFEFVKKKRDLFRRIVYKLWELKNTKGDSDYDAWVYGNCFCYETYTGLSKKIPKNN